MAGWLDQVAGDFKSGVIGHVDLQILRDAFGDAITGEAIQGFIFQKPHGYPGDFEIIEKIYTQEISEKPSICKWDYYVQNQKASIALRNRKKYFIALLQKLEAGDAGKGPLWVMNVASGPMRDVYLIHRSAEKLISLAIDCGIDRDNIRIGREPEGVNFFLHIKQADNFIPFDEKQALA